MKENIKVCHIIYSISSGGIEQLLINYFSKVDKEKIIPFLIYSETPEESCKKKLIEAGFTLIQMKNTIDDGKIKYTKELIKIFKNYKFDIVHCNMNINNVFHLIAAKIAKIDIRISHSHTITKETKNPINKYIFRPTKKYLSTILATNRFACSEEAGKYLFKNNKFDIIYNAINLKKFDYNEKVRIELRKELDLTNNFVVGHIGRFTVDKNQLFLIDLFKKIKEKEPTSKLLIIGDGPLKKIIINKINELELSDSVIILDPREEIDKYYQIMDLFLLPSFNEGLGMVLIEAQANKLPCVCSTGIPKIAKISNGIKFMSLKNDNMDKWVEESLKIKDKRNNIVFNENKYNFDINIQAEKLTNIYLDLIKNK